MRNRSHSSVKNALTWICFFTSITFILCVTLLTREQMISREHILVLFHSYYEAFVHHRWGWISQGLLNMLLFVPLGVTGYLVTKKSISRAILIGLLLSIFVEVTQYFTKLGFFETDDIINNTIGTAIGAGICFLAIRFTKKLNKE